jgi:prolyl-tRNA synthetase
LIARASQLFLPTLRDDPADAEAVSHKLLVRGGFVRQVAAGLWTFTPLGWRVHRNVERIVREELDAIGAQEWFAPVLTPIELWQATGRAGIPELFHLQDRAGREYVLPLTHEETFAFHARELQSYRQLPQAWYHFQTKDRDEPRPRGGLLRVREFVMKDSYSFDRDEEGLEKSFRAHEAAYHRIFERCGIRYEAVLAESGMMGGTESYDYLAPSGSGENTLVTCANGDYAADLEIARAVPPAPQLPATLAAPEEVETPGTTTIEAVAALLGIDETATSKALPMTRDDGTVVLALVRGDDRLDEGKLSGVVHAALRPATEEEIRAAFGADPGYLGPVGFAGDIVLDEALAEGQYVAGANRNGWHLRGVEHGRDFQATVADIRQPKEGDACALCGGALQFQTAIEVGHIFKLGTRFSEPLNATFLDEEGKEHLIVMGSYGIGPGRVLATAVEQNGEEGAIRWPAAIAPYDVEIVSLHSADPEILTRAEELGAQLEAAGLDVLLDDREARPGEKFNDADLIGAPIRITVGKKTLEDGAVDVRNHASDERVPLAEAAARVGALR